MGICACPIPGASLRQAGGVGVGVGEGVAVGVGVLLGVAVAVGEGVALGGAVGLAGASGSSAAGACVAPGPYAGAHAASIAAQVTSARADLLSLITSRL